MNTDTERLEWLVRHEAFVTRGSRMKTRRGGVAPENLDQVYQVDWVAEDKSLCWHDAEHGHPNWRDAIDAAMQTERLNPITPKQRWKLVWMLRDGSENQSATIYDSKEDAENAVIMSINRRENWSSEYRIEPWTKP